MQLKSLNKNLGLDRSSLKGNKNILEQTQNSTEFACYSKFM